METAFEAGYRGEAASWANQGCLPVRKESVDNLAAYSTTGGQFLGIGFDPRTCHSASRNAPFREHFP